MVDFYHCSSDLNEVTDTITQYVLFCEELCISTKTVKCFPNNKPWVTKDIKAIINEKKRLFSENNKDKLKICQKKLDKKLEEGRQIYKDKINESFHNNKSKDVWDKIKQIIGTNEKCTGMSLENGQQYANDLNDFYSRFDKNSVPKDNDDFIIAHFNSVLDVPPCVSDIDVCKKFRSLKANKSHGPDKISPRLLKTCPDQLAVPYSFIFNESIKQHTCPRVWKTSEIVPVPKKQKILQLNDLRPIALTSVLVKCLERLILTIILPKVTQFQDPCQFAYKSKRSVDDAILIFVDNIYKHIEVSKTFCRIMFIDFSSAFNTIQPRMLVEKLMIRNVNKHICAWIFDFLTNRPQFVRLLANNETYFSETSILSTGAPQGTCISPALFTIYTDDCKSSYENVNILKFADDTAIQGLLSENDNDFSMYKSQISNFVSWCKDHFLQLNVSKTKEMIIDFRIEAQEHPRIFIDDQEVERVENYKYLGVHINNKLDWHHHSSSVISKINQRLYFVRKLKYFNIDNTLISLFYRSIIVSVVSFCIVAWGGNAVQKDIQKINKVVRQASKLTGIAQHLFIDIFESNCKIKFSRILKDLTHPFSNQIKFSERSGRIIFPVVKKERYKRSFLPTAIKLHSLSEHR